MRAPSLAMIGKRVTGILLSALVTLVSVAIVLALCEYGLRTYLAKPVGKPTDQALQNEQPLADRHVAAIVVPPGVNQAWFRQSPPEITRDPKDVPAASETLFAEYIHRGVFGPQSFYVWNSAFVDQHVCAKNDYIFGSYGDLANTLRVFSPLDGSPYPRYRFPSNTQTPSGLRTNRYGFRGPELTPSKPAKTIRVAFLGASTTVANHQFPFSYPEYFGYWLNIWLAAHDYSMRVEIINAGREGVGSTDIAAIFEQEVLPLAPDYVIYYEGANDVSFGPELVHTATPLQPYPNQTLLPSQWGQTSVIVKLINDAYRIRFAPLLAEWRRPDTQLVFPNEVDELEPDIGRPDLPINRPTVLKDLNHIANLSKVAGAHFFVSSFIWLDGGESAIHRSNSRHAEILSQVNKVFWPLSHQDVRRLANFQNRVFERFASAKNVGFLDIAKIYPRDPNLFNDAIHFTPEGVRLQGWLALATFLPYFIRDLEDGWIGKAQSATATLPLFVPTAGELYVSKCAPTASDLALARTLPISAMDLADSRAVLSFGTASVVARSAAIPWAYIGRLQLHTDCARSGDQGWVSVTLRVSRGTIGIGALNRARDDFLVRSFLEPSKEFQTIFLFLNSFRDASEFIVQNGEGNTVSESVIRRIQIIGRGGHGLVECRS